MDKRFMKVIGCGFAALLLVSGIAGCGTGKDISGVYIAENVNEPKPGWELPPDDLYAVVLKKTDKKGYAATSYSVEWSSDSYSKSGARSVILGEPNDNGVMVANLGFGMTGSVELDKDGNLNDPGRAFGISGHTTEKYVKVKDAKDLDDDKVRDMAKEQKQKHIKAWNEHEPWKIKE